MPNSPFPKEVSLSATTPHKKSWPLSRILTILLVGLSLAAVGFVFLLPPSSAKKPKPVQAKSVQAAPVAPAIQAKNLAPSAPKDSTPPALADNLKSLVAKGGLAVTIFLPAKGPELNITKNTLKSFTDGRLPAGLRLVTAPQEFASFATAKDTWPIILIYHRSGLTKLNGQDALKQLPQTLHSDPFVNSALTVPVKAVKVTEPRDSLLH